MNSHTLEPKAQDSPAAPKAPHEPCGATTEKCEHANQ